MLHGQLAPHAALFSLPRFAIRDSACVGDQILLQLGEGSDFMAACEWVRGCRVPPALLACRVLVSNGGSVEDVTGESAISCTIQ